MATLSSLIDKIRNANPAKGKEMRVWLADAIEAVESDPVVASEAKALATEAKTTANAANTKANAAIELAEASSIASTVWAETSSSTYTRTVTIDGVTSLADILNVPLYIRSNYYGTTTATTLNINGLGAKALYFPGMTGTGVTSTPPYNHWVRTGGIYSVSYNGTHFDVAIVQTRQGTTGNPGLLKIVDSIASTSTSEAAAPNSVKTAYDKAAAAYDLALSVGSEVGIIEKGTWTPTANEVYRYEVQSGTYFRIGGMVTASFDMIYTGSQNITVPTNILISGLPYAATANATGWGSMWGSSFPTGSSPNGFRATAGVAYILPMLISSSGGIINAQITGASQFFIFSGSISYPIT